MDERRSDAANICAKMEKEEEEEEDIYSKNSMDLGMFDVRCRTWTEPYKHRLPFIMYIQYISGIASLR